MTTLTRLLSWLPDFWTGHRLHSQAKLWLKMENWQWPVKSMVVWKQLRWSCRRSFLLTCVWTSLVMPLSLTSWKPKRSRLTRNRWPIWELTSNRRHKFWRWEFKIFYKFEHSLFRFPNRPSDKPEVLFKTSRSWSRSCAKRVSLLRRVQKQLLMPCSLATCLYQSHKRIDFWVGLAALLH